MISSVLILWSAFLLSAFYESSLSAEFSKQFVRVCLKAEFTRSQILRSSGKYVCSSVCLARGSRCQGFRLRDSVCVTFEFDKCSHMVNEAACNNFEWVYVRKQEGLSHGQLCPDGYGNRYMSSVYKMVDTASWTQAMNICSSQRGLTKFSDAFDIEEVDHFHTLKAPLNADLPFIKQNFYVGGNRTGSALSGSWWWPTCNTQFVAEVWGLGQPNEGDTNDKSGVWYTHAYGLDDQLPETPNIIRALCECVNPFD